MGLTLEMTERTETVCVMGVRQQLRGHKWVCADRNKFTQVNVLKVIPFTRSFNRVNILKVIKFTRCFTRVNILKVI